MKALTKIATLFFIIGLTTSCSDSGESVATVGGDKISKQQFDAYLKFKRVNTNDEKQVGSHLKLYVEREALAKAIEESKLLDQDVIDAELAEFKKEMLISRYFEKHLKDKVSDEAIRGFYASNSNKYESQKVKVAHILIRTQKNMSETETQAKYSRAAEAYSKLKTGVEFATIAKEYSEDSVSVKKGGEIGWINEGAVDPVFSEMAFKKLKKDEISEPFKTSFGYHIVKLLEEPSVVKKPLESVKGDIRYQLRKKVRQAEIDRLMATQPTTIPEKQ